VTEHEDVGRPALPFVRRRDSEGEQRFSTARAKADLDRAEQEHRHREAERAGEQRRTEEAKDNAQRRLITNAVAAFLLVTSVVSFVFAVGSGNATTRDWAQSIVTLLLGGLVGFLTGRTIK